jgi:hypothetical protein
VSVAANQRGAPSIARNSPNCQTISANSEADPDDSSCTEKIQPTVTSR